MRAIIIICLFVAQFPGFAQADNSNLVDATDPKRIASILQDEGYRGKVDIDDEGKISIRSAAHGADFQIYFQACAEENAACEVLAFSAGFDLEQAIDRSIIEEWNRTRWTKSYRDDEGDPFLEFNVNAVHGVSEANFRDTVNWYVRELSEFVDLIGWQDAKSNDTNISNDQPI